MAAAVSGETVRVDTRAHYFSRRRIQEKKESEHASSDPHGLRENRPVDHDNRP